MNKIIWLLILTLILLTLILSGCFLKKKQQEDFSEDTLHLFATEVFLNDTFYSETMPIFENIFNKNSRVT